MCTVFEPWSGTVWLRKGNSNAKNILIAFVKEEISYLRFLILKRSVHISYTDEMWFDQVGLHCSSLVFLGGASDVHNLQTVNVLKQVKTLIHSQRYFDEEDNYFKMIFTIQLEVMLYVLFPYSVQIIRIIGR